MEMIFTAEGFVHTEEQDHYVCELPFNLELDTDSLEFEFHAGGRQAYFHVTDPAGMVRVQQMASRDKKYSILSVSDKCSGPGTCPGTIRKGQWKITAFAFGARTNSRLGRVDFVVKVCSGGKELRDYVDTVSSQLPACGGRDTGAPECNKNWLDLDEPGKGNIVLREFEPPALKENSSRWLKGDFHAHTCLSDGSSSAQELLDEGISKKLDFFFITEHGILTTGFPEGKNISVFPGYEVTTSCGHFNLLGIRYMPEKLLTKGPAPEWDYLEKMVIEMKERGALFSVNHPFFKPWQWIYDSMPLSLIDCIEIVTDPYDAHIGDTNELAVKMIDLLWNEGYRVTGIGGSDTHTAFSGSQLGQPLTEVYSVPGSMKSLLGALKRNNAAVYLDTGCRIFYSMEGSEVLPGAEIRTGRDADLLITAMHNEDSDPLLLRIVENGNVTGEHEIPAGRTSAVEKKWGAGSGWLRCELRDKNGILKGFINPIHRGGRAGGIKTWKDAVAKLGY